MEPSHELLQVTFKADATTIFTAVGSVSKTVAVAEADTPSVTVTV